MNQGPRRKTALITGASRGIGRALAEHFAMQGYNLCLVARNPARLHTAAKEIRASYEVHVDHLAVDLSDHARAQELLSDYLSTIDCLDILVNSAGIFNYGTTICTTSNFSDLLSTNVLATHTVCCLSIPYLEKSDNPHIFNIASITGVESFAAVGAYAASKHALVGYSHSLRKELLQQRIAVTVLCPDVVATEMSAPSGMHPDLMIAPDDICKAISFVMSLSKPAIVDQLVIKCRSILEMTEVSR